MAYVTVDEKLETLWMKCSTSLVPKAVFFLLLVTNTTTDDDEDDKERLLNQQFRCALGEHLSGQRLQAVCKELISHYSERFSKFPAFVQSFTKEIVLLMKQQPDDALLAKCIQDHPLLSNFGDYPCLQFGVFGRTRLISLALHLMTNSVSNLPQSQSLLVEIAFLVAPQIDKDDLTNKIFLLIFVQLNLRSILKPEYKSKIIPLLNCIFDSRLLKQCPGVHHTYNTVFEYIADSCLDFLAHDVCQMQVFMDECTFIENAGTDQFDVEISEDCRAALMPELFILVMKKWHKRASKTLAPNNDWRYLPVTNIATVAVRRFKEVIGVQKPGAKVLKKNENWYAS